MQEITLMPKALQEATETEVLVGCPCCKEALVLLVRVAGDQLCVGITSVNISNTQRHILEVVDRSRIVKANVQS